MMKHTDRNLDIQSQNSSKKSFGFVKWLIKAEFFVILALLIIQAFYAVIPLHQKNTIRYMIDQSSYNSIEKAYSQNDFTKSLASNTSLSDNEKKFIEEFLFKELFDNYTHIDSHLLNKRLDSLEIKYTTNNSSSNDKYSSHIIYGDNSIVSGKYNSANNTIYIFSTLNEQNNFETCNKEVLFHELNHLTSSSKESILVNRGTILSEVINELFTREYFLEEQVQGPMPYDSYMPYAYALCELIPCDVIKEYKYTESELVLINYLLEIDNNIDEAYLLIDSINSIDSTSSKKSFHDSFEYFYSRKYNKSIADNITILTYLCETGVLNAHELEVLLDYFDIDQITQIKEIIPKGYINTDKVIKMPHSKVYISNSYIEI